MHLFFMVFFKRSEHSPVCDGIVIKLFSCPKPNPDVIFVLNDNGSYFINFSKPAS